MKIGIYDLFSIETSEFGLDGGAMFGIIPKPIWEMKAEPENPWQRGIWLAQMIDSWRIFPRMFLSVYIFLLYYSTIWFMELPEPTLEQSGLISIIVGAGAAWFGLYAGTHKAPTAGQK